jgi:hypothetical protein
MLAMKKAKTIIKKKKHEGENSLQDEKNQCCLKISDDNEYSYLKQNLTYIDLPSQMNMEFL